MQDVNVVMRRRRHGVASRLMDRDEPLPGRGVALGLIELDQRPTAWKRHQQASGLVRLVAHLSSTANGRIRRDVAHMVHRTHLHGARTQLIRRADDQCIVLGIQPQHVERLH